MFGPSAWVIAELHESADGGREPNLPEDVGYVEVATPDLRSGWRLYQVFPAEKIEGRDWPGTTPVSPTLAAKLEQADKHPTALTFARGRLLKHFEGSIPTLVTRDTFLRILEILLGEALRESGELDMVIEPMGVDEVFE